MTKIKNKAGDTLQNRLCTWACSYPKIVLRATQAMLGRRVRQMGSTPLWHGDVIGLLSRNIAVLRAYILEELHDRSYIEPCPTIFHFSFQTRHSIMAFLDE